MEGLPELTSNRLHAVLQHRQPLHHERLDVSDNRSEQRFLHGIPNTAECFGEALKRQHSLLSSRRQVANGLDELSRIVHCADRSADALEGYRESADAEYASIDY